MPAQKLFLGRTPQKSIFDRHFSLPPLWRVHADTCGDQSAGCNQKDPQLPRPPFQPPHPSPRPYWRRPITTFFDRKHQMSRAARADVSRRSAGMRYLEGLFLATMPLAFKRCCQVDRYPFIGSYRRRIQQGPRLIRRQLELPIPGKAQSRGKHYGADSYRGWGCNH